MVNRLNLLFALWVFLKDPEHYIRTFVGATIINEDIFQIIESLAKKSSHTSFDVFLSLIDGDNDANFRLIHGLIDIYRLDYISDMKSFSEMFVQILNLFVECIHFITNEIPCCLVAGPNFYVNQ